MQAQGESVSATIVQSLFVAIILVVFAVIGGLIGIPLFEKRKGGVAVPPPPPAPGAGPYAA
jgi:hypothetical protein